MDHVLTSAESCWPNFYSLSTQDSVSLEINPWAGKSIRAVGDNNNKKQVCKTFVDWLPKSLPCKEHNYWAEWAGAGSHLPCDYIRCKAKYESPNKGAYFLGCPLPPSPLLLETTLPDTAWQQHKQGHPSQHQATICSGFPMEWWRTISFNCINP